jgi:hypothetical protein
MKNLQDVLEQIKSYGSYGISLMFGDDIGCDDSDIKILDRNVKVWWCPVGVIGEARILLRGNLNFVLSSDIGELKLKKVSNPPKDNEIKGSGLFIWGSDRILKGVPAGLMLKDWTKNIDRIIGEHEKFHGKGR